MSPAPVPSSRPATIPASHADLAECPPAAALTTLMPGGAPQTSVVWCDAEDGFLRVNTMRGFQKERNMRRDPRVAVLAWDPREPRRFLEVEGVVDAMIDGHVASRHLDAIASKYAGHEVRYFGDVVDASLAATERPVLCRIRPVRVTALDVRGDD